MQKHDTNNRTIKNKMQNLNTTQDNHIATDTQDSYHEIIIEVSCKQKYLQEVITQNIADIILEHGDGVEFIDGNMVALDKQKHDS